MTSLAIIIFYEREGRRERERERERERWWRGGGEESSTVKVFDN